MDLRYDSAEHLIQSCSLSFLGLLLVCFAIGAQADELASPMRSNPAPKAVQEPEPLDQVALGLPALKWQSAGTATIPKAAFVSSLAPAPSLPATGLPLFNAGKALAHQPWVKAPTTTTARDGLGPLYNVRACLTCHANGGRGVLPDNGKLVGAAVVRLEIPAKDSNPVSAPDPTYGDQIQIQSVSLADQLGMDPKQLGQAAEREPPAEAKVRLRWEHQTFRYPDGTEVALKRPVLNIHALAYGPLHPDTVASLRNAPVIHGMGLIGLIDQKAIDEWADPDDADGDGVSGRVSTAMDPEGLESRPGRFGWKASTVSLRHAVAAAFVNDIGITNPVFPRETCTRVQRRCLNARSGADESGVELPNALLWLVTDFVANIGVPAARHLSADLHAEGSELFRSTGCSACHRPGYTTGPSDRYPHLAGQVIWPFSDFLLHDMGPALADSRHSRAGGREWRTAPLWGLGLSEATNGSRALLHDGRAETTEEAVLWHGGEGAGAKEAFSRLSSDQRSALLHYVESL